MTSTAVQSERLEKTWIGLPLGFWVIWAAVLLLWTGRFVVPFLSSFLTSDGMSVSQATLVVAMYGAGGVIACLGGGVLSDRWGRLPMIMVSFFGGSALLLCVPLVESAPLLMALMLVYGVVSHLGGPALSALVADRVPPAMRGRAYMLQTWAMNLGFALGPMIAGWLSEYSFSLIFVVEAAMCMSVGVYLAIVLRGKAGRPVGDKPGMRSAYARMFGDRVFIVFVALMLCYTLAYFQSTSTLPIIMGTQGIGVAAYGTLLTVNGAMLCLLQLPAMKAVARLAPSVAIALGVGLAAVGFLIHLNATTWSGHLIAVVVWTLGELVTFPFATTIVANLAPADLRATYQGVYNLIWSAAHALAPVVGGQILAHLGADWMWRIMAGVLVSAAVGLVTNRKALQAAVAERTGV